MDVKSSSVGTILSHPSGLMGDKLVIVRLNYDGIFKKKELRWWKDFCKIGGVYTIDDTGWKLLTRDKELLEIVDGCENDGEIQLYVDTVVDKEVEPSVEMQPWVIVRPRKNIMKARKALDVMEGTLHVECFF
ncbi:hypothetical protein AgCh_007374 [Apium graveolens]